MEITNKISFIVYTTVHSTSHKCAVTWCKHQAVQLSTGGCLLSHRGQQVPKKREYKENVAHVVIFVVLFCFTYIR